MFVPVLTLPGVAGRLFAPLGLTYGYATLASLLVALTVTPALCLALLAGRQLPRQDPAVVRWTKARYGSLLEAVGRRFRVVLGVVVLLMLAAFAAISLFGAAFLPELREGHFIIHMLAVPGTSLQESLRLGRQVMAGLMTLPFARSTAQRAGRAEKADDTWGTHYTELNLDLEPMAGEAAEFAVSDVRKVLAQFPGVNFAVKTFLTERVEETLSGYTAAVVVNIYGADLDALDRAAQDVAGALAGVLPLAIGSGEPGREIEGPMAIVVLGGLITSTLLNLLVLPGLTLRYGAFRSRYG